MSRDLLKQSVNTLYGISIFCVLSYSNVYTYVVSQVQGLASFPVHDQSQSSTASACALVDLVEAVTHVAGSKAELQAQLTTQLAQDDPSGSIDASHLPPPPIDWSHVTGLLPLVGHSVRQFKEQFVSLDETIAKVGPRK
jgi:hypothetical protein